MAFLRETLKPGDVAIDAGACIATMSVPLARAHGVDGRVKAIEGFPETANLLEQILGLNGVDVEGMVVDALVGASQPSPSASLCR